MEGEEDKRREGRRSPASACPTLPCTLCGARRARCFPNRFSPSPSHRISSASLPARLGSTLVHGELHPTSAPGAKCHVCIHVNVCASLSPSFSLFFSSLSLSLLPPSLSRFLMDFGFCCSGINGRILAVLTRAFFYPFD